MSNPLAYLHDQLDEWKRDGTPLSADDHLVARRGAELGRERLRDEGVISPRELRHGIGQLLEHRYVGEAPIVQRRRGM